MALPIKQPVPINFSKGLNLKIDPYQVPVGNFLSLVNTVFDKVGRLTKRNGFGQLTSLPDTSTSYLSTFKGDLQALGNNLLSYSSGQASWISKGTTSPLRLSALPLIRGAQGQVQADSAVAPNGLVCTAYTESPTTAFKYTISDSNTGQTVVAPTALPSADSTYGTPRVFLVGNYFVILYTQHPGTYTLNYLAISWSNPSATPLTAVVASAYQPATTVSFDGAVFNNTLYIAYSGASASGIKLVTLTQTLVLSSTFTVDALHNASVISVAVDAANSLIWLAYWTSALGFALAVNPSIVTQLAATQIINSASVLNLTATAQNNTLTFFYELANNYSYDSSVPSHYVMGNTVTKAGTVGTAFTSARSIGLASKAFLVNGTSYYLAAYQSPYQPTYFLINGSTSRDSSPAPVARLAYSNGGGYVTTGLPAVTVNGTEAQVTYLYKDTLESIAPAANSSIGVTAPQIYSLTGVNLATFNFDTAGLASVEAGNSLNLSGGFLWMYDGYKPVEQNFLLWPDSVEATWSATGGFIHAQPDGSTNTNAYYYQAIYEWTDLKGNVFRSAPSIPVAVSTGVSTSTTGSITINVPFLRLTYKTASSARIIIYRWSVANPVYYQVTAVNNPIQNLTTSDSYTWTDTLADSSIVGNNIIYTTGGVVENVGAPASNILSLFDDRLWLVDAEDPNLLWYSKTILEATPVEMSDLFTLYIDPTLGVQGSTGDITALFPMDDKLIIFKKTAIYYINGTGPTATGAQSAYSEPIFIASTVGCSNPRSLVMTPRGLMFQSNKGIWLLGRDLSTQYIGDAVEDFNAYTVTSAVAVPDTNQIRFSLSNGSILMYDYYVGQWGEFTGVSPVAATLFQNLHTVVDQYGRVFQEAPGTYLDGASPVLMSFVTSWLNVAGLRGYLRAYWVYLLGTFLSPHKLQVELAYDYNPSPVQSSLLNASSVNYAPAYGDPSDPYYGGDGSTPYGGPSNIEQFRIFLERQRCRAFQISIQEVFDPTYGTVAGPGLTLSGLNCIVGVKKAWAPIPSNQQAG